MKTKVVIIGGVAGGANAATRLRRLSEDYQITMIERGEDVSFANCGLPYYVGGEIEKKEKLLLQSPSAFKTKYNIDVLVKHEVIKIDKVNNQVAVLNLLTNELFSLDYDHLVIATGGSAFIPPIKGRDSKLVYTVRDVPDVVKIKNFIEINKSRSATVVGGGFIGIEMAEQLVHLGLKVRVVQSQNQVLGQLDQEMAELVHDELRSQNIELILGDAVSEINEKSEEEGRLNAEIVTKNGQHFDTDLIILAIGIRPESKLAKDAGLELGESGGIKVDNYLKTSHSNIWAVGDCIEVKDLVTNQSRIIPLAGPANRQGRVVANNIHKANSDQYRGSLGTSVLRVFSLTVATVGASERLLNSNKINFEVIYLHPNSHAGYYPGATPITFKVLFDKSSRKLLGVQAIGKNGVEKRVDVLATAIKSNLTIDEIADLELCYAPPYGSAKDPVNMIGMMAQNICDGLVTNYNWDHLSSLPENFVLLDVREEGECSKGMIPNAVNIPLSRLREEITSFDRSKEYVLYCQSGQRSYNACRILSSHGFKSYNLSGAYRTYLMKKRLLA